MKKYGLLLFAAICLLTLVAQKKLNIYKTDATIKGIGVSRIDSLKFSDNQSVLNIHKADKTVENITLNTIDSITVSDLEANDLPVVKTVAPSAVSYTTAQSGVVLKAIGNSDVTERGICWGTAKNPTIADGKSVSLSTADSATVAISGLNAATTYNVRAYATNGLGTAYGAEFTITTLKYTLPTVETVSATYNYSTNKATCVAKVNSNGGCSLTDRGICWGTTKTPTINDSKYANGTAVGQFYALMSNLNLNATYYVRTYATNCVGTAYGNALTVKALMGNVTFTMGFDSTANPEPYRLIKIAMDSACVYYNRYTSFTANVWVAYNSGVPTAEASYHGQVAFGSNTRYMWVGTAIHELAHYFGSGTTTVWKGKVVGGIWTGTNGSTLLKNQTGEVLKGDAQHFWPYGINQKEEITGLGGQAAQENGLALSAKLVQAMVKLDCGL